LNSSVTFTIASGTEYLSVINPLQPSSVGSRKDSRVVAGDKYHKDEARYERVAFSEVTLLSAMFTHLTWRTILPPKVRNRDETGNNHFSSDISHEDHSDPEKPTPPLSARATARVD